MVTTHLEKEAAFEGTGVFDPKGLRSLPAVERVREQSPEELDAVYYDTADLRLLAHGITLGRRGGGHDAGWHLRLPAADGGPREVHAPLSAGRPGKVPSELGRRVAAYARGRKLLPVAHLRTHRRRHLLLDVKGRPLAEVAQDRVAAQVLGVERLKPGGEPDGKAGKDAGKGAGRGGGTSTRLVSWSEIVVELDRGDGELLRAAGRRLTSSGYRPSATPSRLDRALTVGLSRPAAPARKERTRPGTAGEAVMRRFGEQVDILLATEAAVRADEPDAVHLMRSTSRRLRNLLRGNRRLLDRRRTEPVAEDLRRLTGVLAGSRDHEVLGDRLRGQAAALDRPADPALVARVAAQEAELHARAHAAALAEFDEPHHHALLDALDGLRADPPLRRGRAGKPAVKHLREVAARDQDRVAARMARAEKAHAGPERDRALHDARKAVRRARHTAETAVPYAGAKADRFRRRTKAVQQILGDHQDAVMAREALPGLAAGARQTGTDPYGYGRLHALQDELARDAVRALPGAWRKARAGKLVRF